MSDGSNEVSRVDAEGVTGGVHSLTGKCIDGKYQVLMRLGAGGMGSVYRAEHVLLGRPVAVKVLHPHLVEDAELLKRFHHEAKVASRLDHPNAIEMIDYGIWEGAPYLVMEFAEGKTLKDRMSEASLLSLEELRGIFLQVTAALMKAHELGIVHRDLKPDNIMLTAELNNVTRVRVLDFGIAKVLKEQGDKQATVMTQTGTFFGTPKYASPEQVMQRPVDGRSDIYTLGIILYEVITGAPPFDAPSVMEVLMKQLNEAPEPLGSHHSARGRLPAPLCELVMRCLAKDPAKRPQSMQELHRALTDVDVTVSKQSSVLGMLLPAALGVGVALGAGIYLRHPQAAARWLANLRGANGVTQAADPPLGGGEPPAIPNLASRTAPVAETPPASENREPAKAEQPRVMEAEVLHLRPDPSPVANPFLTLAFTELLKRTSGSAPEPSVPVESPQDVLVPTSEGVPAVHERVVPEPSSLPAIEPATLNPPPAAVIAEVVATRSPAEPAKEEERVAPALDGLKKSGDGKAEAMKLYAAGRDLLRQKRYAEAAQRFEQAIQFRSDAVGSYLSLGNCYDRLGQSDRALAAFQTAARIDASYAPSHYSLAMFLVSHGREEEGLASLSRAVSLDSRVASLARSEDSFRTVRGSARFQQLMRNAR